MQTTHGSINNSNILKATRVTGFWSPFFHDSNPSVPLIHTTKYSTVFSHMVSISRKFSTLFRHDSNSIGSKIHRLKHFFVEALKVLKIFLRDFKM